MGINDIVQIGNTIKKLRIEKGLTQKEMADKLEIPPTTYSNYENNHREPNKEILEKICQILKVTPNQLIVLASFEAEVTKRTEIKEKLKKLYDRTERYPPTKKE